MREFPTKAAMRDFYKSMLGRYRAGDWVTDGDAVDLHALLARHPWADEKIGAGVSHFDVRRNGKSNGFWIVRSDGSETDFSYLKCVNGDPPQRTKVSAALRLIVANDIHTARDALFIHAVDGRIPCAITGQMLLVTEGHMDHQPPMTFEAIVAFFLAQENLAPSDVVLVEGGDGCMTIELADPALVHRFRDYHNGVAKFAFIEAHAHLSLPKRRTA